jgi:hypothetical protein
MSLLYPIAMLVNGQSRSPDDALKACKLRSGSHTCAGIGRRGWRRQAVRRAVSCPEVRSVGLARPMVDRLGLVSLGGIRRPLVRETSSARSGVSTTTGRY